MKYSGKCWKLKNSKTGLKISPQNLKQRGRNISKLTPSRLCHEPTYRYAKMRLVLFFLITLHALLFSEPEVKHILIEM